MIARWLSSASAYAGPRRLRSAVEPSMSENRRVIVPDGRVPMVDLQPRAARARSGRGHRVGVRDDVVYGGVASRLVRMLPVRPGDRGAGLGDGARDLGLLMGEPRDPGPLVQGVG